MKKLGIQRISYHPSKWGFSTSRRSPEEYRRKSPSFDKFADSSSFSDQVRLSNKIIDLLRTEEWSKGCDGVFEEGLHTGIVVVFWKKKIVVFKLNIWYSLERYLLSNYYKNMNTFSILLTLAYQIMPIVLFVWLILYLAKKIHHLKM